MQLKKIIKDVVSELSGMGLSPDVLNKLLITEEARSTPSQSPPSAARTPMADAAAIVRYDDTDILEFEFESDEASPPSMHATSMLSPSRPKRNLVDPILDTFEYPNRPSSGLSASLDAVAGSSFLGTGQHQRKFRVRLLSESRPETPGRNRDGSPGEAGVLPMSVSGMFRDNMAETAGAGDTAGRSPREETMLDGATGSRGRKVIRHSMSEGGRVKAEYILGGTLCRLLNKLG
jgi:hypothetical protein